MEERRNFIRFQNPTNILINVINPSDMVVDAFIEDISKGGISLVTNRPFKEKQIVTIGIRIPTKKDLMQTKARVVWSTRAGSKNQYKSGLKFTDIKPSDRADVLGYVYEEWRKNFDKALL